MRINGQKLILKLNIIFDIPSESDDCSVQKIKKKKPRFPFLIKIRKSSILIGYIF